MIKKIYYSLFLLIVFISPSYAAQRANMMLVPTRVIMTDEGNTATIQLKNTGNATGQFSVSLQDMEMLENGSIIQVKEGDVAQFSAIPYLHVSPKSMTVRPGDNQIIRIMKRRNAVMEPGEYRAHLKVRLENDNVEAVANKSNFASQQNQTSISVKANLSLVIPVIVRVGETSFNVRLENTSISYDNKGKPFLNLSLKREGNRSCMGDFTITYKSSSGSEKLMTFFPGIPVYRPTPKREVSIPLDVPAGVNLRSGSLEITYSAQESEGGKPLAQTSIPLK